MKNKLMMIILLAILFSSRAAAANSTGNDSTAPTPGRPLFYQSQHTYTSRSATKSDDLAEAKKFAFSVVLTPKFDLTVPPVSLYFEKGIAKFTTLGLNLGLGYDSDKKYDYHDATVLIGARACGYVMPAIAVLGNQSVKSYGFDPYAGLAFNYYVSAYTVDGNDAVTSTGSNLGLVLGSRWYPGNKRGFGILAEYCTTGIAGASVRFGITLGR